MLLAFRTRFNATCTLIADARVSCVAMVLVAGLPTHAVAASNAAGLGRPAIQGATATPNVYYDLPEMLINVRSRPHGTTFLKVQVTLDLKRDDDVSVAEENLPRIMNDLELCLRGLDEMQIQDSKGMERLRQEILRRIDTIMNPVAIRSVLFKEFVVGTNDVIRWS